MLFVNAGIAFFSPNEAVDEAFFDRQFNLNVKGAYFTIQQGAAIMADGGSIILTGSVAGVKGQAGVTVYGATKAALRSFARTFATELGPRRIRVNTLSPGPVETPIFGKSGLPAEAIDQFVASIKATMPLARIAKPEEMATVALFLASDDSSYVTGVDLLADGGLGSV